MKKDTVGSLLGSFLLVAIVANVMNIAPAKAIFSEGDNISFQGNQIQVDSSSRPFFTQSPNLFLLDEANNTIVRGLSVNGGELRVDGNPVTTNITNIGQIGQTVTAAGDFSVAGSFTASNSGVTITDINTAGANPAVNTTITNDGGVLSNNNANGTTRIVDVSTIGAQNGQVVTFNGTNFTLSNAAGGGGGGDFANGGEAAGANRSLGNNDAFDLELKANNGLANGAAGASLVLVGQAGLSQGNIGIGTTSPLEKLEVAGNTRANGFVIVDQNTAGAAIPNNTTITNDGGSISVTNAGGTDTLVTSGNLATALNNVTIGTGGGTTQVDSDLNTNGNTNLGNDNGDTTTVTGTLNVNGPTNLNGGATVGTGGVTITDQNTNGGATDNVTIQVEDGEITVTNTAGTQELVTSDDLAPLNNVELAANDFVLDNTNTNSATFNLPTGILARVDQIVLENVAGGGEPVVVDVVNNQILVSGSAPVTTANTLPMAPTDPLQDLTAANLRFSLVNNQGQGADTLTISLLDTTSAFNKTVQSTAMPRRISVKLRGRTLI